MSAPDPSPDSVPGSIQPSKPQRVLACILCQQRKVKCDRKHPCANCVKARAQCIPATQVTRQRKRRFPERDLLDRLRKYEDILRQNNIKFDPLHKESSEKYSPKVEYSVGDDSDEEPQRIASMERPSPATTTSSERIPETKNILHAMSQEFRDPDNHSNSSDDDVRAVHIKKAMSSMVLHDDHLLFGSGKSSVDISTFHPEPIHIFKLWQLYLDNVNPLLKVTHTPSLQGRIIEAASNISSIDPPLEALMFSIYCMAVLSLNEHDCIVTFGSTKEDLMIRYQFGCQQALLNCGFLRTTDRECLTALFLYLVSVRPVTVPQSLSSMLGVAIRIAQRMGIDKEAMLAKVAPLEAEMRRRLWWALVLFDARVSETADAKVTTLTPIFDCRVPLNVADSDLRPQMKEPPQAQNTFSDAIFAVVRSEVGNFIRHTKWHLDFNNPALLPVAQGHQPHPVSQGSEMGSLESLIEENYLKVCDPEIPLHFMTIWTARGLLAKCRLLEHYSRSSSIPRAQADAARDAAFGNAITMIECNTKISTSPLTAGFLWMIQSYYPFPAYVQIIQNLKHQPHSPLAERAWEALSANYEAQHSIRTPRDHVFYKILAPVALQAWAAREEASEQLGEPMVTPRLISYIRQVMLQTPPVADTIQQVLPDVEMKSFPISIPMNFDQNMFLGMGGQQGLTAPGPWGGSPDMLGIGPLNADPSQLDWSSMDWNLGNVHRPADANDLGQALRY
ncbi:hypothetical protein BKA65DRAFT_502131 [Rhexocercosporidium sp. MPI-PUGE-AT-0058]|nr:hypothetical protein BKA65DRAFT_502131 [Rhexocercosporidium sp. MPI-PUGE-AT-0058]